MSNSNLGFLRRNLHHCPKACRMNAYLALVRSKPEYGCVTWDPHLKSDIDKLEKIQRSAAQFITRDYRSRHEGCITEMLQDLGLQSLEERQRQLRLTFLYKVVEGRVPAINIEHYLKSTGDQEVAGSTPAEVGNILSWRLIMKYFLRSFSPFR